MTSVLIVEDEDSLADPLAFLLRKEGFEATIVNDGPSALAEFERAGADIVLLDLMLPEIGGTEVCRGGIQVPYDNSAVSAHMDGPLVRIECGLGLADGTGVVMGVELGYGYIDENRTTS